MLLNNFPIHHNNNQYEAKYNCSQMISWHSLIGMILFAEKKGFYILITNSFNIFILAYNIVEVFLLLTNLE